MERNREFKTSGFLVSLLVAAAAFSVASVDGDILRRFFMGPADGVVGVSTAADDDVSAAVALSSDGLAASFALDVILFLRRDGDGVTAACFPAVVLSLGGER